MFFKLDYTENVVHLRVAGFTTVLRYLWGT